MVVNSNQNRDQNRSESRKYDNREKAEQNEAPYQRRRENTERGRLRGRGGRPDGFYSRSGNAQYLDRENINSSNINNNNRVLRLDIKSLV